jgi:hypothetical protein
MLQGCYRGVHMMLKVHFIAERRDGRILCSLHAYYQGFMECHRGVTGMLQWCYRSVCMMRKVHFTDQRSDGGI